MKLKSFKIENLFNTFEHEIIINNEEGITIVIGENGIGKTVILEIIEAIFNKKFFYLSQVVFDKITLEFTDNIRWVIIKEYSKEMIPNVKLYPFDKKLNKIETKKGVQLNAFGKEDFRTISMSISRHHPYLRRVGPDVWEDRRMGMIFGKEELIARYGDELPLNMFIDEEELPKWVVERIEANNVSLIKTQRLLFIDERERERERSAPIKTVEKYSIELSKLIKSYLAQSTELSSKLDRTYPNRLIKRIKEATDIHLLDLTNKLKELEEKRELLDKVGLIEIDKDSRILDIDKSSSDVIKEVLMLYVEDSFNKLTIFDEISRKIEILLDIINKRFKHKKLFIDKEKGFLLKSTIISSKSEKPIEIPVDKLSSGEQNELVLFYELLFKSKSNSLILIDEPEISLHISWQNSFIEDLKEIATLNNLEILIATHSPDIIADNWELKVELKGVE
jgi:predicted ATP-binding protein involved in virulence